PGARARAGRRPPGRPARPAVPELLGQRGRGAGRAGLPEVIGQRDSVSGAHFAFTDRWGGVSAAPYEELNLGGAVGDDPEAVTTNRELAAKSLGLDPERVVWMNQVHGADVAVVDAPWGTSPVPSVDAIVTARRGLALA